MMACVRFLRGVSVRVSLDVSLTEDWLLAVRGGEQLGAVFKENVDVYVP